jgi:hypothetical protein
MLFVKGKSPWHKIIGKTPPKVWILFVFHRLNVPFCLFEMPGRQKAPTAAQHDIGFVTRTIVWNCLK